MCCDLGVVGYKRLRDSDLKLCLDNKVELFWKGRPKKVTALYANCYLKHQFIHPSIMEHVKFHVNLPRPLGKAKYYLDDR
jgi:hypothetical protein